MKICQSEDRGSEKKIRQLWPKWQTLFRSGVWKMAGTREEKKKICISRWWEGPKRRAQDRHRPTRWEEKMSKENPSRTSHFRFAIGHVTSSRHGYTLLFAATSGAGVGSSAAVASARAAIRIGQFVQMILRCVVRSFTCNQTWRR